LRTADAVADIADGSTMTMFGAPLEVLHALIEQRELIVVNNNAGRVLCLSSPEFRF
jgi:acyl CoA:acetate/3-ketoacid CoA transferase alpha subunit